MCIAEFFELKYPSIQVFLIRFSFSTNPVRWSFVWLFTDLFLQSGPRFRNGHITKRNYCHSKKFFAKTNEQKKNRHSFCIFGTYFSLSNTFFFYVFFLFQDYKDIECPQVPPASYWLTQTFQSPN